MSIADIIGLEMASHKGLSHECCGRGYVTVVSGSGKKRKRGVGTEETESGRANNTLLETPLDHKLHEVVLANRKQAEV